MPASPARLKMALAASCACGSVTYEASGTPILGVVCYCDDCQEGGRQIEALSNAPVLRDVDGGTPYLLFRKDRFACIEGGHLLKDLRIRDGSPTRRVVATCCNSGMFFDFEKGHWISAYRKRFGGNAPQVQMRIQTRFRSADVTIPNDLPAYAAFSFTVMLKLVAARIAMMMHL